MELWLPEYKSLSNSDIYELIKRELERLAKTDFKKRYINLEIFNNV